MLVISWVGSWSLRFLRVPVGTAVLHPQPWSARSRLGLLQEQVLSEHKKSSFSYPY